MRVLRPALGLLVPFTLAAQGELPAPTARDAYAYIQAERAAAESLWTRGELEGIHRLTRALAWLERPQVRELFADPYLAYRPLNVWNDLAAAYWVRGDTSSALHAFEQAALLGQSAAYVARDTILARIAALPGAAPSRRVTEAGQRLWRDSAFVTPFRDTLPEDERLAGLALLWAELRYGFIGADQTPGLDWDRMLLDFLPRVRGAPKTFEYYRLLEEMVARVGDGHTNVYFPPELASERDARPPIRTRLVQDSVVVTDVLSPRLEATGVQVGDVIERIDGRSVEAYVAANVRPYQSASTPQDLAVRTYDYGLLRGARDAPVLLTLRHRDGRRSDVLASRSPYPDVRRAPPVRDTVLAGGIGYLRVDDFASDTVPELLRAAMRRLAETSALIVDLRWNGGGNTSYGFPILRAIARESFLLSRQRVRLYSAYYRAAAGISPWFVDLPAVRVAPDSVRPYRGAVALLIGPATYSAAEDFAVAWRTIGQGPIVGMPSGGSTGQPMAFPLPGNGRARVRTKWDSAPDGSEFNGVGVRPDLLVIPTLDAVREGRDETVDAAVRLLAGARRGASTPARGPEAFEQRE